uniref:Ankyrin repeat protein n=1 Tax=Chelonoidis abingdonii TaxID=106734 RepID=A0A8C0HGU5_CHEAB
MAVVVGTSAGRWPCLESICDDQGADLERKQKNHQTPLHFAVEKGKFRVVQYLLNSGASVSCLDENHYSALHMAAVKGKYLIGEKLIKYRANVDLRTDKGWTPLTPGLDNHAKLNVKGGMDWTSLHMATRYSEESVVCELLRSEVDPNIAEKSDWTPLHLTFQRGAFLSIINLLEHKADIIVKNKVGWTPLRLTVLSGNVAIIKTLINAGAVLHVEDMTVCTPLQLAIRNQKQSIATLLQGKDLPVNNMKVLSTSVEKHWVSKPGHTKLVILNEKGLLKIWPCMCVCGGGRQKRFCGKFLP